MILCLRTDSPTAEVYVYSDNEVVVSRVWEAHRTLARDVLRVCSEACEEAGITLQQIMGVIIYQGPGSFTGLRIGVTTANTMAYSLSIPIVGVTGDEWITHGLTRLHNGENDQTIITK